MSLLGDILKYFGVAGSTERDRPGVTTPDPGRLRRLRCDDAGYLEVIPAPGFLSDVNLTHVADNAVVEGGINGVQSIAGPEVVNAAATAYPVQVGGEDPSGNVVRQHFDAGGRAQVVGTQAAETAVDDTTWPVKVALKIRHTLSTITDQYINHLIGDDYGRLWVRDSAYDTANEAEQVVGAQNEGSATLGKPVEIGGVDGVGNLQSVLTDTDGRPQDDIDRIAGADVATTGVSGTIPCEGTQAEETSADDGSFPVKVGGLVRDTPTTIADGQIAKAIFDEFARLWVRQPNFTEATESNRAEEIDPLSEHHVESTLADVTNGTDNTYYYYLDMDGYRKAGFHFILDGGSGTVTATLEGTIQDDDYTAASSCTYIDVTNKVFGVASTTSDEIWGDDAEKLSLFKYIRVKIVAATGGANDADWTIYAKRLY